jgi:hypothetical protein
MCSASALAVAAAAVAAALAASLPLPLPIGMTLLLGKVSGAGYCLCGNNLDGSLVAGGQWRGG